MSALRRLWRGELALADAVWSWAVLGGLAVNIVTSGVFMALMTVDQTILALVVGYAIPVPYNFVATVGVWRAADRFDGDRRWAEAARYATLIGMIVLSIA